MSSATLILIALSITSCLADDHMTQEFVGAVYRGNSTHVIAGNSAVGAGGAIVRAGDTFLTPEGAYVKVGDTYLKPGGGAVVRSGDSYIGSESAVVKVSSGANLMFVGSDGASIGAGDTILRSLFIER
jgi:hypothetical protein